jgi:hypothetical protein
MSLMLISSAGLLAQSAKVTATIDTTRMLIGDQVNLWLEAEHPSGFSLEFPVTGDSLAGKVEVLSASPLDTVSNQNSLLKIRQRLVLTAFDTGFYVIPPFIFRTSDLSDSLMTRALPLEVLGIPVDTTKGITDIKLPYEIPVTLIEVLPYIVVGLLLITMLFLYIRYLRKKRQAVETAQKPDIPPVPAHIWALGELDELVREKLWQQGKVKLYYSRLTDIIRRYIELRYSVPAMEQTTEEIVGAFTKNGKISVSILSSLGELLQLADLVKFAKWTPVAEEHEASQQSAYDFILRTKPVINLRTAASEQDQETKTEEQS